MTIANLPDDTVFWSPETGEVTLGEIRGGEERPAVASDREATILMWCHITTRNLCRTEWELPSSGDTRSERRASAA